MRSGAGPSSGMAYVASIATCDWYACCRVLWTSSGCYPKVLNYILARTHSMKWSVLCVTLLETSDPHYWKQGGVLLLLDPNGVPVGTDCFVAHRTTAVEWCIVLLLPIVQYTIQQQTTYICKSTIKQKVEVENHTESTLDLLLHPSEIWRWGICSTSSWQHGNTRGETVRLFTSCSLALTALLLSLLSLAARLGFAHNYTIAHRLFPCRFGP